MDRQGNRKAGKGLPAAGKMVGILCALCLVGCGLAGAGQTPENMPETTEERETSGEDIEPVTDQRANREILTQLLESGSWRHTWFEAGISEEDTEEVILQKLEQWESLELGNGKYLPSLECLRLWPNLKRLVISYDVLPGSPIQDFSPIAELTQLRELYIKYPAGEGLDFSFLAQMDTLRELFLVNCDLEDSSFLEEMPQLQCLSLYKTPVDDLAVLGNLTELVELSLYGNREAEHIETVGRLLKMQDLGLQDCGISDISFLSSLKDLRGVNLNYNSVTDLSPLTGLSGLERLGLVENEVSDLSPIAGLDKLYDLALDGNSISDISALSGLSRLNQVGLSNNRIGDFSPLADKTELVYAAVSGNPCADLRPVAQVPLLNFGSGPASEEQLKIVTDWMEKQRPDVEEYECIDFSEADLDGDGLQDAAFVLCDEPAEWGELIIANDTRHMYILLQQKDGSYKELKNDIHIMNPDVGGMRGDPYRRMWMGEGQVLVQHGWGSSTGTTSTEIYRYQQGSLKRVQTVNVDDCNWAYGYDVTIHNELDGTWSRYALAHDGDRMVKVALASDEYPVHRAFSRLSLYYDTYHTYPESLPVSMDTAAALEYVREYLGMEVTREALPYVAWQKKGYELLKGVELPDYYYVVRKDGDGETDAREDCIYYFDLETDNGEYYHVIRYEQDGRSKDYRINDSTGELKD